MSNRFDYLDTAILKAIDSGITTYTAICNRVQSYAQPLTHRHDWQRVVDRRLQAIRKRGGIVFEKKEWKLGFRLHSGGMNEQRKEE